MSHDQTANVFVLRIENERAADSHRLSNKKRDKVVNLLNLRTENVDKALAIVGFEWTTGSHRKQRTQKIWKRTIF